MPYLTKDQILSSVDMQYQEVDCPEWGGKVLVRSLSGAERDQFEAASFVQKGKNQQVNLRNVRARLVARCVVSDRLDNGGKQVFSKADIDALGKKNAAPLDRLFAVCQNLCGLTSDDLKDLTENFNPGQGEDFGID